MDVELLRQAPATIVDLPDAALQALVQHLDSSSHSSWRLVNQLACKSVQAVKLRTRLTWQPQTDRLQPAQGLVQAAEEQDDAEQDGQEEDVDEIEDEGELGSDSEADEGSEEEPAHRVTARAAGCASATVSANFSAAGSAGSVPQPT